MAATMADYLQSILSVEVVLPDNLLPDDMTLIYDDDGNPIREIDFNDPENSLLASMRKHNRYVARALAHYNGLQWLTCLFIRTSQIGQEIGSTCCVRCLHDTDYKLVKRVSLERYPKGDEIALIHCGFTSSAAPSAAAAAKHFCADFEPDTDDLVSCCIADGKTTYCDMCGISTCGESRWEPDSTRYRKSDVPPLSEYSHNLAEGVTLSDKAKIRVRYPLLALAYYNKKQHVDYKLVDALHYCVSNKCWRAMVAHCNFIARQSAPADAPNKLFFAEFLQTKNGWVVSACCVVRGKTTAGCHNCPRHKGKRVIHPTHGFHFGLYLACDGPQLRRRS